MTHPKDVAQALLKAATASVDSAPVQVKSFDATIEELSEAVTKSCGRVAKVRPQGILSGKSLVGQYPSEEIRAGLTLEEPETARKIGYSPTFDIGKVATDVSEWYRKEPWVTQDLR